MLQLRRCKHRHSLLQYSFTGATSLCEKLTSSVSIDRDTFIRNTVRSTEASCIYVVLARYLGPFGSVEVLPISASQRYDDRFAHKPCRLLAWRWQLTRLQEFNLGLWKSDTVPTEPTLLCVSWSAALWFCYNLVDAHAPSRQGFQSHVAE